MIAMVTQPFRARLDALTLAEFGSGVELVLRLSLVIVASFLLAFLAQHTLLLVWLASLLITQSLLAIVLTRRLAPKLAGAQVQLGLALYALSQLIFIGAPLYLINSGNPGLVLAGALTLVATLLCKLQHAQDDHAIARINAGQFIIAVLSIVLIVLPEVTDKVSQVIVPLSAAAVIAYYIVGMRENRLRQQAYRESRMRYAQSQKARAMTQFVGGVAHDFNNILTAIMGNLELARILDDPKEREDALDQAQNASERAAITVQQLLASSGRSRLRPETLTAADLHKQMEQVLPDLLEPGITLQSAAREAEFAAFVDRDMLETVLIQLCLNAQDAMKGSGNIWLHSRKQNERPNTDNAPDASPPYLAVSVLDNGPGVESDSLDMLSEPFFTTKSTGQGPGLGLSAVQGFARQSGGALLLENRPEGGFCATILLPRA
ncbi:sensor histidine kinase [Primorskyibacter sp. 2E107]|uniref:sensor histidine kinase n=1 Tax=Primorskyibacter sp. 2E107 TaxID=3403458 RepID=UPI003AF532A7